VFAVGRRLGTFLLIVTALRAAAVPTAALSADLEAWVGIYPYDRIRGLTFLEIPNIRDGIVDALGKDALTYIKEMAKVGPIIKRGDWLIAYGCQPDACTEAKWWFAINLTDFKTRACLAIINSSTVRFGASARAAIELPRASQASCPEPEKIIPIFDNLFASATQESFPPHLANPFDPIRLPLKKDGGTYGVPVEINGALTLFFVVDSGAADVSLSMDVFSTLIRAGTIDDSDLLGEDTYVLADGSKSNAVTFIIRSLKIGDKIIKNVKGSVGPSKSMLLLGQSFLGRFNSWSIDNTKHELVLDVPQ
jgi:clan AA aspartic protease (TIGR02281 family)